MSYKIYQTQSGQDTCILKTKGGSIVVVPANESKKLTFGEYTDATTQDVKDILGDNAKSYLNIMEVKTDAPVENKTTAQTGTEAGKEPPAKTLETEPPKTK